MYCLQNWADLALINHVYPKTSLLQLKMLQSLHSQHKRLLGHLKKKKKYVVSSNIAGEDNINTQLFVYGQTCVWQLPDGTILEQIMFACKHARFCVVVAVYGFSFAYFSQQS